MIDTEITLLLSQAYLTMGKSNLAKLKPLIGIINRYR